MTRIWLEKVLNLMNSEDKKEVKYGLEMFKTVVHQETASILRMEENEIKPDDDISCEIVDE